MLDFYILWTYSANYSEKPFKIRAYNAKEAITNFTKYYSDDFQKRATVYAFTEPPALRLVMAWKNGKIVFQSSDD